MPWVSGSYTKGNSATGGWTGDASLGIGIEAGRHDTQDNDFATGINNCLAKDGSNAATGNLDLGNKKITNLAGGTANADAINVAQLNALIPPGSVITTAATSAPSGWLLCDGAAVNRTTYATLFAAIGTTYGAGDGSTTFNIPDLRRRTPTGVGTSDTVGTSDGVAYASRSATQTHTIPPHYHGMGTGADLNITSSGGGTTGNDSPDHTHNIGFTTNINSAWTITGSGTAGYNTTGTTTTTGASARHTHSTPNHTHPSGNIAGRVGLVTGGVDGNATMTSGAGQYLYMNYIIKHQARVYMAWSGGSYTKGNASTGGWTGDASLGIGIEAGRHDTQDDDFATGINQCLNKDGTNAMTGNLNAGSNKIINLANGTVTTDAVAYGQLSVLVPSGTIVMSGRNTAPTGWLICDGTNVSRTTYSDLFSAIGVTYGAGDGSTTFGLPDLRQRFPLGKAASGTGATLGGTGGAIDHTHSVPAHYHSMSGAGTTLATGTESANHTHALGYGTNLVGGAISKPGSFSGTSTSDTGIQSANHTHAITGSIGLVTGGVDGNAAMTSGTNNPPFLTVNFIIKT